jgi:hypothetical protein
MITTTNRKIGCTFQIGMFVGSRGPGARLQGGGRVRVGLDATRTYI